MLERGDWVRTSSEGPPKRNPAILRGCQGLASDGLEREHLHLPVDGFMGETVIPSLAAGIEGDGVFRPMGRSRPSLSSRERPSR